MPTISVGHQRSGNSLSLCVRQGDELDLGGVRAQELAHYFPAPMLSAVGDEIADGTWEQDHTKPRPLALFDAVRIDYSLRRLIHYSGTDWRSFQPWILLTNYHRYVDQFIAWAWRGLPENSPFVELHLPGGHVITRGHDLKRAIETALSSSLWHRYQMPAYHLTLADGGGITLVNIGIGPSNAKEHDRSPCRAAPALLADDRPLRRSCASRSASAIMCWRMAIFARIAFSMRLVPPDIPVPALAEVQVALQEAAARVTGESGRRPEGPPAHRHRGHQ